MTWRATLFLLTFSSLKFVPPFFAGRFGERLGGSSFKEFLGDAIDSAPSHNFPLA